MKCEDEVGSPKSEVGRWLFQTSDIRPHASDFLKLIYLQMQHGVESCVSII
jgi:hypothetical protein